MGKWWPWFCELYTVYTMYTYSFSLLLNLFKERYINAVKSNKYMPFFTILRQAEISQKLSKS